MGVMKRIATTRIWNPEFTGKLYDPELAAMARLCRKGAERPKEPDRPPQVTRESHRTYQGELPF